MSYIDERGQIHKAVSPTIKGWWRCISCGGWCGFLDHRYKVTIHRHAFCRKCDNGTLQESVNYE